MTSSWKTYLLLEFRYPASPFLSSSWPLEMLSLIWLYFAALFAYFETRQRWHQLDLEAKADSDEEHGQHKAKRFYTLRLRSEGLNPNYKDMQATLHFKFFFLKERIGQIIIPVVAMRRYGHYYTDEKGSKYLVLLFHWYSAVNLFQFDDIRIAHSSRPESPEIYLRDLDIREPELKIRVHLEIFRSIAPFPFVPGSGISLKPSHLGPSQSDDFRSPYEKITKPELIIFMFSQSNVTFLMTLWLPSVAPGTEVNTANAIYFGVTLYLGTTALVLIVMVYYQMCKIHFSPLRRTNLKKFRRVFLLTMGLICGLISLIAALLATRLPDFTIKFWIVLFTTGHCVQALFIGSLYFWYDRLFSLELYPQAFTSVKNIAIGPLTRCIQPDSTNAALNEQGNAKEMKTKTKSDSV